MTATVLLQALAFMVFGFQVLALMLKRDKQEKYILWPLLFPPLTLSYVVLSLAMASGKTLDASDFMVQVLGYQVVIIILSFFSKQEGSLGQAGFWLPVFMNFGTAAGLIVFTRGGF